MKTDFDAIIGVWDGHDAGAALIVDGQVQIALNEERLSGRKLDVGFPTRCLEVLRKQASGRRVAWAVSTSDPAKTLTRLVPGLKERYYKVRRRLTPPGSLTGLTQRAKYSLTQLPTGAAWKAWTRRWFAAALKVPARSVFLVDHHEAHAASAAYWPEWGEDALIVTLDGIGDGASGSVWRWHEAGSQLEPLVSIPGSASFGLFFEHVTNELQMRPLEDEGKVMALATFAADLPAETNPFLSWFELRSDKHGHANIACRIPPARMAAEVARIVWCTPREQVCRMAQQTLEHFIPAFFARWAESTGVRNFGYAGGVASNIKVNRLVRTAPGIDRLEVCPAMGDGGLALGAALAVWRKVAGTRPAPFSDFRLGPEHIDLGAEAVAVARDSGAVLSRPPDIAEAVADLVAEGEVVMWAQGRMELGARALGARSIVARADSIAARDALNLRLKRRVWFQPFCPTMLESEASQLLADFRGERDVNRHMTNGFLTTPAGREALAGAIGPDGSCRPQMVADDSTDAWARMLLAVKARTGVGAVINTSLNVHGKPMPDSAEAVVAAWLESGVRHLALGSVLLSKTNVPEHVPVPT